MTGGGRNRPTPLFAPAPLLQHLKKPPNTFCVTPSILLRLVPFDIDLQRGDLSVQPPPPQQLPPRKGQGVGHFLAQDLVVANLHTEHPKFLTQRRIVQAGKGFLGVGCDESFARWRRCALAVRMVDVLEQTLVSEKRVEIIHGNLPAPLALEANSHSSVVWMNTGLI
jgi:hypothetical protein